MNGSIVIFKNDEGNIAIVGPDGFDNIAFERTLSVMAEVRKRINYLNVAREATNIIPFPLELIKDK